MDKNLLRFSPKKIKFSERPQTIPANQRLTWKMSFILFLIAFTSRVGSTSLKRLNLFVWALQHSSNSDILNDILRQKSRLALVSVRFDPTLPRVLSYLTALGLIELNKGKYKISDAGKKISKELKDADNIFTFEKSIISGFDNNELTEKAIEDIFKNG